MNEREDEKQGEIAMDAAHMLAMAQRGEWSKLRVQLARFAVAAGLEILCAYVSHAVNRLRPECRHILHRHTVGDGTDDATLYVRCLEPTAIECEMGYCPRHCDELCGSVDDGDPDEEEAEPETWSPEMQIVREKIEA